MTKTRHNAPKIVFALPEKRTESRLSMVRAYRADCAGPGRCWGLLMVLREADAAAVSGDVIRMLQAYERMRELK